MFDARIGANMIVFGLGTPLDHPPETTQWVTAWAGGLYILYIYRVVMRGARVRWSSGGHETKNNTFCPDPRVKIKHWMSDEKEFNKLS